MGNYECENRQRYSYINLFRSAIGNNLLVMDVNVRPHRASLVTDYLEDEGIERI